jgi:hypothetical protein
MACNCGRGRRSGPAVARGLNTGLRPNLRVSTPPASTPPQVAGVGGFPVADPRAMTAERLRTESARRMSLRKALGLG